MILLSKFHPTSAKKPKHHLFSPCVPEYWNGYYAIFRPTGKCKFWTKKWFATNKSKSFKNAVATIETAKGHQFWNDYLNGKNTCPELDYITF